MNKTTLTATIVLGVTTATVTADVIEWSVPQFGQFETASSWSPAQVPGQLDTARFDTGGGSYSVQFLGIPAAHVDIIEFFDGTSSWSPLLPHTVEVDTRLDLRGGHVTSTIDMVVGYLRLAGGDLTVSGGSMTAGGLEIGVLGLGEGTLTVDGAATSLDVTAGSHSIGTTFFEDGTLDVTGGAEVTIGGDLDVGPQSALRTGFVNVSTGGRLTLDDLDVDGGVVDVAGAGSQLDVLGTFELDNGAAYSTMSVHDQAVVSITGVGEIGEGGTLTVSDNGQLSLGSDLDLLGDADSGATLRRHSGGALSIADDASVIVHAGALMDMGDGYNWGGTSSVSPPAVEVRSDGAGLGGAAQVVYAWRMGFAQGTHARTVVSGAGATLIGTGGGGGADVTVGFLGAGNLLVENGGLVDLRDDFIIGDRYDADGLATVIGVENGIRSRIDVTGNATSSNVFVGGSETVPVDCCYPNGTPGCGDVSCETIVCAADSFCCDTAWDSICAESAVTSCDTLCPCAGSCQVLADLEVRDGGLVHASGDLQVARAPNATASVQIGGAAGGFDATLQVSDDVIIGGSDAAEGGTGTVTVETDGVLDAGDQVKVWTSGTLALAGGTVVASSFDLDGTLTGAGSIQLGGSTLAGGIVQPTGIIELDGNYWGDVTIELSGPTPGAGHGQLHVSGDATIIGLVEVTLAPGFTPSTCDRFVLVRTDGIISNVFASADLPPGMAMYWSGGELFVQVQFAPADLDYSGTVDVVDLLQLLAAWGACPGCPEDLDGDGFVAVTDLLQLLAEWNGC